MVVIREKKDYQIGYKVSVCFNVSQKESFILSQFKKYLQCGTTRARKDGVAYYEVNNFSSITGNVIPFFKRYNFLSENKKSQFSKFCQVVELMEKGEHLNLKGFEKILEIRKRMNHGGKSSRKNFKS